MGRLDNKRAVVTGATGGIGAATCRRFCQEGAEVFGADLDAEAGERLQRELTDAGGRFTFAQVDVTDQGQVAGLAGHAAAGGEVDVVFANAGRILGKPLLQTTVEEWESQHAVNSSSVFYTIQAFAPVMTNPGGSIIVTSSAGAIIALENMAAYAAAKASAMALTKGAAVDLAPGIRVNCLLPGTIDTAMPRSFVSALAEDQQAAAIAELEAKQALGRMGRPEEVAATALFLASDDSSFFTAAALTVDGGASAI